MPKYIYLHPDTDEEFEIIHAMDEVKNPSVELLKKITLPDGRIMKRKIVAPALVGFDNLGRSILNRQEKESTKGCEKAGTAECECSKPAAQSSSSTAKSCATA